MENPKPHGKSYNKWLGDQAKPSHREQLRVMIDRALEQNPADFDALLKLLSEMGCEVSRRGKAIRLKAPGRKNVARMDDKLGAGYSEAEIRAVLAGEKQHTPRKKSVVQPEPPKVNLLVDIQAKLQAGKGAGYERWAKVFNLKQMAQTMNYLSENNLLEYAVLEEKAAAATAHHNELSALPSTSMRRGKSQRDFLLCGPVCINTGIACRVTYTKNAIKTAGIETIRAANIKKKET